VHQLYSKSEETHFEDLSALCALCGSFVFIIVIDERKIGAQWLRPDGEDLFTAQGLTGKCRAA
jgi:hypothetical protein